MVQGKRTSISRNRRKRAKNLKERILVEEKVPEHPLGIRTYFRVQLSAQKVETSLTGYCFQEKPLGGKRAGEVLGFTEC